MQYFLDTVDTIPDGLGFTYFKAVHLTWLAIFIIVVGANCFLYNKLSEKGRALWGKIIAWLIVADEIFKDVMLIAGGNFSVSYLPFHLCSINIFMILLHAYRPSKLLNNFLYTVCIPGAIAALLFCTWTALPV